MPNSARSDGPWFNRWSQESLTDPGTWDHGLALYISQHVLSLDIEPVRDGWLLQGEVQGTTLHAACLLQVEMTGVAGKKHRKGFADVASKGLKQYAEMNTELHMVDPLGTLDLALGYQLSTHDAAYLWLAAELKAPLATFDEKLVSATKAHLSGLA